MKTTVFLAAILFSSLVFMPQSTDAQKTDDVSGSKIQVALLLDTSNSMDGLIDQAKTELWSIVNELATARYDGKRPELEIALYEYGNDNLEKADGYIRLLSPFTTDLDAISELLFALKTYGGYEYCGQVIGRAAKDLNWSDSNSDLKMIVIAGNEEFTQGMTDYKVSCKEAFNAGIIINTIFCGDINEGIRTMWKDGAECAKGKYLNIDQNQTVASYDTPFDDDILELNEQLNNTYIAYGQGGAAYSTRQSAQDMNAEHMNKKASVGRAVSKSSGAYKNAHWDLVDATEEEQVDLSEISTDDLPSEMKNMSQNERQEYVKGKKNEREKIKSQILEMNKKRDAYIAKMKRESVDEATLGTALISIVREQALAKNYTFKK